MSRPFDVIELTVARAQAALAAGTASAADLVEEFLERIAEFNPAYNAVIFLNPVALDEARDIDARRAAGEALGPLAGIPVVVKDTMDMRGFPTTGGWRLLHAAQGGENLMPLRDSAVVTRLRAAGAVILGKTNVPILSGSGSHANDSWAGPTFNAVDRGFLPGGSSTGTATAVAASMAVLGLAEETGGSIQNPASAQALVGIKPTVALVPNVGVLPLSSLRDVVGPIARCVRDAALALDAIAGYTAEDPMTVAAIGRPPHGGYAARLANFSVRGKRIGSYGPGWRDRPLAAETLKHYARVQRELSAQGAVWVADPFAASGFAALRRPTPPFPDYDERGLEAAPHDLHQYLMRMAPGSPRSFAEFAAATASEDPFAPTGVLGYLTNLPGFNECLARPTERPNQAPFVALRESYLEIIEAVFTRHGLDALLFPQMRSPLGPLTGPQPIEETTVSEINIAGLPGVTAPAGYYDSGAPFNVIIVGRPWSEADLLGIAYAYESATRYRRTPRLTTAPPVDRT